ncbi:PASTA domain-containing protein [Plantactinospora sp. B5E13]|uniref:PASTA domain-containing protein n=1 Tax=Plantactinospora sp. B5E13 TaxID=3153758 RepID=UPI00325E86C3
MADDPQRFRGTPEPDDNGPDDNGPDDNGPDAAGGAAETRPIPPGPAEPRAVPPGPSETQVIPPGPAEIPRPAPVREPTWAGRAEVPVRPAYDPGTQVPTDWAYAEEQDGRRWWMPILVAVIGLVLLAVLLVAGWVIADSVRRGTPAPPPATPSGAASAVTSASTSAAPTSAVPTTPGTTPAAVAVPPLVGLSESAATGLLEQLGLVPELRFEASDEPAGTVLATEPEEGAELTPGDVVVLVIAEPAPSTPPATTGGAPTASPNPTPNG